MDFDGHDLILYEQCCGKLDALGKNNDIFFFREMLYTTFLFNNYPTMLT
jgi:hypothetical protein